MAPTKGRVAMPERRWDCRHGTLCTEAISLRHIKWLWIEHNVLKTIHLQMSHIVMLQYNLDGDM